MAAKVLQTEKTVFVKHNAPNQLAMLSSLLLCYGIIVCKIRDFKSASSPSELNVEIKLTVVYKQF